MRRARRAVVFVAAALIASVGAVAPAGAGKFGDVVAATLSPGSKMSPRGHFYLFEAKPGDSVTQSFRVSNPNDHPVTATIEAVDATTGELTGVQLGPSRQRQGAHLAVDRRLEPPGHAGARRGPRHALHGPRAAHGQARAVPRRRERLGAAVADRHQDEPGACPTRPASLCRSASSGPSRSRSTFPAPGHRSRREWRRARARPRAGSRSAFTSRTTATPSRTGPV